MAIWFMRLSATICMMAIVGGLGLFSRDWYRSAANESAVTAAQQYVRSLEGSMSLDEGDYVILLYSSKVDDQQIEQLVALLRPIFAGSSPSPDLPQTFAFNLAGTQVGDRGLTAISTLPVTWLNLNGTRVTDQGLLKLRNQERLILVTVAGTQVTESAIVEMREFLPQLWIPVADRAHLQ